MDAPVAEASAPPEKTTKIPLRAPNQKFLPEHIKNCAERGLPMVEKFRHRDAKGVVICGPAPSLTVRKNFDRVRGYARRGWHVIAIKEAIRILEERGVKVDYSVSMDPGSTQWMKTPRLAHVTYCVASTCHPSLFDYLLAKGLAVEVFHSACGYPLEVQMYLDLFECPDVMQGGYSVLNRAFALSKYMGFPRVAMAGADFGWRPGRAELDQFLSIGWIDQDTYRRELRLCGDGAYYAAGVRGKAGNEGNLMLDHCQIDGRLWCSRPDMVGSAIHIARHVKKGNINAIIGDSMAAALAKRDDAFLKRVLPRG